MRKIVVPEGIVDRLHSVLRRFEGYPHPDGNESKRLRERAITLCEEFAAALSENPIRPTNDQLQEMENSWKKLSESERFHLGMYTHVIVEWIRRMFLAPEPEIPPDLEDMMWAEDAHVRGSESNKAVIEAYRRGKAAK